MTSKEVFLFDENAAIKKLDSETKLTKKDNEKKISSDLKTDNLKENKSPKKEVVKNDKTDEKKKSSKDLIEDIDDPFFFS